MQTTYVGQKLNCYHKLCAYYMFRNLRVVTTIITTVQYYKYVEHEAHNMKFLGLLIFAINRRKRDHHLLS
jgi:hypothetical protein